MNRLGLALPVVLLLLSPGFAQEKAHLELDSPFASYVEKDFPFFTQTVDARNFGENPQKENLTPRGIVVTVGDEFQGVYATLGAALAATLHTRLAMIEHADCRFGIGRGTITPLDDEGSLQDGPAWWAARDALGYVEETAERAATRAMRTSYRCAPDGADAEQADKSLQDAVNAALACRDHLVGSMSDRSRRLLGGLMHGTPQRELAEAERISPSAVSQRIRADGLAMLLASETLLAGLR